MYIYTDLHVFIYLCNYLGVYIQTNILYIFIHLCLYTYL